MTDISPIYPSDSNWRFRWGYQGLIANIRFKKLMNMLNHENIDPNSDSAKDANEFLMRAQFGCKYGRFGNKEFRDFIYRLENTHKATRSELTALIEGGDLSSKGDEKIKIKVPKFSAIGAIVSSALSLLAAFLFTLQIVLSPADNYSKVILLILFNGVFLANCYVNYFYVFRTYKIAKNLKPIIENILVKRQMTNKPIIRLVK